ncbi:MAG: 2-phospho-L-lactate guanylyltransferase [Gammaproteobacteria bacterium]
MWVAIPVKRFSNAKSRLAAVLDAAERESLAQVMLNDVLRAVSEAHLVSGVVVVSHEVRARYAAERSGGLYLEESGSGLSAAIRQAGAWLSGHGQRGLLMVPGDVPLASGGEIDRIIESLRGAPAVSLAPDREHDGTNALAVTPADAIPYAFGRGSFAAHCAAARAAGIEPAVLDLPGLALDVDNPLDLQALLGFDSGTETETLAWLTDSGIARRVVRRHNGAVAPGAVPAPPRLI